MARRIIDENGMTMKLVEFCNKSSVFLEKFIELIPNYPYVYEKDKSKGKKVVEYIDFTGDYETGYGKPDITIRFTDGSYFYIEVKTNKKTGFQENQVEGSYLDLINLKGQNPENSFAFLLDPVHNIDSKISDATKKSIIIKKDKSSYSIPIFYWSEIYKLVKDMGNDSFARDIEDNVDGIVSEKENLSLTASEFKIFTSSSKNQDKTFFSTIKKLCEPDTFNSKGVTSFRLTSPEPDIEYGLTLGYKYSISFKLDNKKIELANKIYIGYAPLLLKDGYVIEKSNGLDINSCLFSVAFYYDVLAKDKYKDKQYCIDKYRWVYFPLSETDKPNDDNDIAGKVENLIYYVLGNNGYLPNNLKSLKTKGKQ